MSKLADLLTPEEIAALKATLDGALVAPPLPPSSSGWYACLTLCRVCDTEHVMVAPECTGARDLECPHCGCQACDGIEFF